MKTLSRILFPSAVVAAAAASIIGFDAETVQYRHIPLDTELSDTVIYEQCGYKLHRVGEFEAVTLDDSLLQMGLDSTSAEDLADTLPHLTARDTIKVPDSLRYIDPFRYKYFVALCDSLTHVIVRDSLKHSEDSLRRSAVRYRASIDTATVLNHDTLYAWSCRDSAYASHDSLDWHKLDSLYAADSTAAAKAAFDAWYASLSRKERKKYDMEQLAIVKMAEMDSLKKAKEDKKAIKDSIVENTPRILETYAIPDSLYYKRLITWNVDQDFHKMQNVRVPDTTYNYRFYDFPFQRNDVNASWLGVAGSPVQYYNWFKRRSDEGVDFYNALEPWSFSPRTLPHYNSKTPYTELCYFGTLAAKEAKESDNLHLFTTQNITPAFNFSLLFDRYGGGGFLENENTVNKTLVAQTNYLGKKYLMHAGYISNTASRGENGGMTDNMWIRDTTLDDSRDVRINLKNASSKTTKKTFFLEQQYRIPFNFINRIKARKDSTFVFDADSLDTDVTTAFIGHSSELSTYTRSFSDKISDNNTLDFFHGVANYNPAASNDTMRMRKFDNKLFLRLQPWSAEGVVSKLDVGVGDYLKTYRVQDLMTGVDTTAHRENSMYVYAGAEGQIRDFMHWDAKADYVLLGHDFADFGIQANAGLRFYPFRRARKSPLSLDAHFETTLREPNFYQQHLNLNHYNWDNNFSKISTTRIEGCLDIPRWRFSATVGYALLGNNIYYDTLGIVRQNASAMSVLSASVKKNFVLGPLHLDNQVLAQVSSNQEVLPLPALAFNMRYYLQFVVQRDETKTSNIMEMQIGANAWCNTPWYAPAYNPAVGVFCNQTDYKYTNGPYFDVFVNVQWKRACIFVKYQNMGMGWPLKKPDYFSAHNYILTQSGGDGLKIGIYWPFYTQPGKPGSSTTSSAGGSMSRPTGGGALGMPGGGMMPGRRNN